MALPRLVPDGQFFRLADGRLFTVIEATDFSLYLRYLRGEDVTAMLAQRAAVGFNTLRVWLLNTSVLAAVDGRGLHPDWYSDFYTRLRPFVDLCASFGCYVEFTVFTQTQTLMPETSRQQAHLTQTGEAVRDATNVLLDQVNEFDLYDNACDPWLTRPVGVLASRGCAGADGMPPRPPWDYELYHTNGLLEWWRKTGHNAMELGAETNKPCMSNENTRYPDQDASLTHAYDAAAGAALLCAGACYHSASGKLSTLWAGTELAAAQAWVDGARSVPLEFQRGVYGHRTDLEGPNCIRAYEKRLSDGRSYVVLIRP